MQTEGKSLAAALVKVMEAVDYIPKRGFNKTQGYPFAMDADIADKVRTEMAKQGVVMLPRVTAHSVREIATKSGTAPINTVAMDFTFVHAGSGEAFTISTIGEGMDYGDKGVYKAMTGATKYALLKAFQIPTGDDPEGDEQTDERTSPPPSIQPSNVRPMPQPPAQQPAPQSQPRQGAPTIRNPDEPSSEPQQKRVFALAKAGNLDLGALAQYITDRYGVTRSKDLSKGQISQLMDGIEDGSVKRAINEAALASMGTEVPSDGLPFGGDAA